MPNQENASPDPATLAALALSIEEVLNIATTAAQLASANALMMHRRRMLAQPEAEHLAMLARHLGELFQRYGHDDMASGFGAHAALLRQPPPEK